MLSESNGGSLIAPYDAVTRNNARSVGMMLLTETCKEGLIGEKVYDKE
jgi:hypothetical protein